MLRTLATIAAALVLTTAIEAGGLSTPRAHSNRILIPAAISADGANDTTFRSDIRITGLPPVFVPEPMRVG